MGYDSGELPSGDGFASEDSQSGFPKDNQWRAE